MRFKRHVGNLLGRIGETDGQNRVLRLQCGNGAVEMAFAIADPASSAVEGGEGNEKCRGKDFGRIGPWLAHTKSTRDNGAVTNALDKLKKAANSNENTMPAIIESVAAYATVEEICVALRDVYGIYEEPAF